MGEVVASAIKPSSLSGKRVLFNHSSRSAENIDCSDGSVDLTVEVGTAAFSLHKIHLISRCGRIRSILQDCKDANLARIALHGVPGGPDIFELAARFCYDLHVGFSLANVAALHCAANYLQMTEQFSENNLETQTEKFLREKVYAEAANSIAVLHHCEMLLPIAEEVGLVARLIQAITRNIAATTDIETDLAMLSPDFFRKVMLGFESNGLNKVVCVKMLINYAHNSQFGKLIMDDQAMRNDHLQNLNKRRSLVETIVELLPCFESATWNHVPVVFLSRLLKSAIVSKASTLCVSNLERWIGEQLDQARLDDILIPGNPTHPHRLYDIDSASRVFSAFVSSVGYEAVEGSDDVDRIESTEFPEARSMEKVAELMDSYLAEIASDPNMMPSNFIALAELLPGNARRVDDGLYRAVDIFLKVCPNLTDGERLRLCKAIDCEKLSEEACSHAARNERLPVQMVMQVLYSEQLRLRKALRDVHDRIFLGNETTAQVRQRSSNGAVSPRDNYASVRRENREVKLEVARVRMRLTELEREHSALKLDLVRSKSGRRWLVSWLQRLLGTTWCRRGKERSSSSRCCVFFLSRRRR